MAVLIKCCKFSAWVLVLLTMCIGVGMPAHAESPYPRAQVENHLRAMYENVGQNTFVVRDSFRYTFVVLKEAEFQTARDLIQELSDVLSIPFVGVNPNREPVDLLVFVWDDLAASAQLPRIKSVLKLPGESEEAYINGLRKMQDSSSKHLWNVRQRYAGDRFTIIATERYSNSGASFPQQLRYTVFSALTGSRLSQVMKPSVTNWPDDKHVQTSFAPIDRAVLRAIFGHNDWDGLDYETKIQLLTDRVMEQLAKPDVVRGAS